KIYVGLNAIETVVLMIAGMGFFDALNHAMATMATGGFSTRNASVAHYVSPAIEWILVIFMFIAGTNFSLHAEAIRGRFSYLRSTEFRWYAGIICAVSVAYTAILWLHKVPHVSHPGAVNVRDGF